jgi:hypothetical protein
MISYGEVKNSPSWEESMPNANEPTPKFELALAELIDGYRGKIGKVEVLDSLTAQRDRVNADWEQPKPEEPDGDD